MVLGPIFRGHRGKVPFNSKAFGTPFGGGAAGLLGGPGGGTGLFLPLLCSGKEPGLRGGNSPTRAKGKAH